MRFVNADGRGGLLAGDEVFDLATVSGGEVSADPMTVITSQWEAALAAHEQGALSGGTPLASVRLGPPVPHPGACFGIGLNYKSHAEETGAEIAAEPVTFTKFPACLAGPHDDVVLPAGKAMNDWEAELVFVMADIARRTPKSAALDHVLGFCCGQDISERATQFAGGEQFSMGKSFDTFGPTGPALVTLDELDDPARLHLRCAINGEVKQDAYTDDLIFDVPSLIEFLSSVLTVRAGDLCFSGTPSGVGVAQGQFLQPGDVIDTEIEGLGAMRNTCVAEA
ncbi:MAG: fumarylacetoacetate hydrolase family protein [Actinobacteria bacterium]|nr:fumarylacetoacetate hydrolase family protein [Actinomycetota bacterium]